MDTSFTDREKQILELLKKQNSASIQELAEALSVSTMTIHRDLNRLAGAGHVHKKHGSVSLASQHPLTVLNPCAMCGKATTGQKTFTVYLSNGEQRNACCPHCGLMLQAHAKDVWQSMTTDFLHGHIISANQAIYLIGSDLNVCCVPSILSFGSRQEAEKFQLGFGGKLASMDEAIQSLLGAHHNKK